MNEPRYYIRDENGQVCGVFVAVSNKENAAIGFALCNTKDKYQEDVITFGNTEVTIKTLIQRGDIYSKKRSLEIALGRANKVLNDATYGYNVPSFLRDSYNRFYERCERYYQGGVDRKGKTHDSKVLIDMNSYREVHLSSDTMELMGFTVD
jgi:hypothetical protein